MPTFEYEDPAVGWTARPMAHFERTIGDGSGNRLLALRVYGSEGLYFWTVRDAEFDAVGGHDFEEQDPFTTALQAMHTADDFAVKYLKDLETTEEVQP